LEQPGAVWKPPQDPKAGQGQQQGPIGALQKVPEEEEAYSERRQSGCSAAAEDEPRQRMRLAVLQPGFRAAAQLPPSFHRSALLRWPAAVR